MFGPFFIASAHGAVSTATGDMITVVFFVAIVIILALILVEIYGPRRRALNKSLDKSRPPEAAPISADAE